MTEIHTAVTTSFTTTVGVGIQIDTVGIVANTILSHSTLVANVHIVFMALVFATLVIVYADRRAHPPAAVQKRYQETLRAKLVRLAT